MTVVKKYRVIAKVGNKPTGEAQTVRYSVNNLIKFTKFLDAKFPTWTWMNIYHYDTRELLRSFTKNNRPDSPYVSEG